MEKKDIAIAAATGLGLIAMAVSNKEPAPMPPEVVLTREYQGMATGTVLELNNHKYVPDLLPGYETVADYPDSFWIREEIVKADPKTFKKP